MEQLRMALILKNLYSFDSSITAGKFLDGIIEKGDVILAKGSQGIRMERAVKMIMANPTNASINYCAVKRENGRKGNYCGNSIFLLF
jgi:hypothetical protein